LNYRHADFQAQNNHKQNNTLDCKPALYALQENQPLSRIDANRFERTNEHFFPVQTFQDTQLPCIAIPAGKRRCSECLVSAKCGLNLSDLAQTFAGLKSAEVSQ